MTPVERLVVRTFQKLYYDGPRGQGPLYGDTSWMGVPCLKCPLDLWQYQEILLETRPELVVETGTFEGGSALYLAHLCDLLGHGHVVSIDIDERPRPSHPRLSYLAGSSDDPTMVERALACAPRHDNVLVILDSDHSEAHVSRELALFAPLVPTGGYLIVEDTNLNGHPVRPDFGPGPGEAVRKFLALNPDFAVDATKEKFLMTFNPGGYLKRVGAGAQFGEPVPDDSVAEPGDLAVALVEAREKELGEMKRELDEVRAGFTEAMRQLNEANRQLAEVGAGFRQALDLLSQREREIGEMRDAGLLRRLRGYLR